MARLVNTDINTLFICNIVTNHKSGEPASKEVKIGDVVEGLQYKDGDEIKSITGKITDIKSQVLRRPIVRSTKKADIEDTFYKDVKVLRFVIDGSEEYNSNVVTVEASSVVGFGDVENISSVSILPKLQVIVEKSYTDGTTETMDLQSGDILEDVVIMNSSKGKPDIVGNFTVGLFLYNVVKEKIIATSVVLVKEDNTIIVANIDNIIKGGSEVEQIPVATPQELVTALSSPGKKIITFVEDVAIPSAINTAEDSDITINTNGHELLVPEPVNGRSVYAINNHGKMTIENLKVSCRGIQNYGEMVINDCDITSRDHGGGAALWTYAGSKTVINSGTFRVTDIGSVSDPAGAGCVNNSGELEINGGIFVSPNNRCYAICSAGDTVINNNPDIYVEGAHGGIANDAGTIKVYAGTFKSLNHYGLYVSCDRDNVDPKEAICEVYGGTFEGPNYSVWLGSDWDTDVNANVIIYDGTFEKPLKVQNNVLEDAGIVIEGGKFKDKVPESYLADGAHVSDEPDADGYYIVSKN